MSRLVCVLSFFVLSISTGVSRAQPLGEADRASPGDAMIQEYLRSEAAALSDRFSADVASLEAWQANRARYAREYMYMLGLDPLPEKTPLEAVVTGALEGEGYVVEMLHYQSRPRLYVTANLYRPAKITAGQKLPAVLYVCGHSGRGRNGNKTAFQSHGIWFARHGYVCLVVDTLQLGEIAAKHHGTYNLERWWWHSRGYTPAGVEAWNGIRGIDYLASREDVDPRRIGVTGISGGGAATFWIAAADERAAAAVPVSGMADLESYVPNRVINGHCDCMFLYNTFQWPWTRIAALVAPRPMLFANSDNDPIFPMDANERISNRLERLYSLFGAGADIDALVSVGGHAYRRDIREGAYRFLNLHLKGDGHPILDSERDVVSEGSNPGPLPIAAEKLRAFPDDADLPRDELNTTIDQHFVPLAEVASPESGAFAAWKSPLLAELKRVSFAHFPDTVPAATELGADAGATRLGTEGPIEIRLRELMPKPRPASILLAVLNEEEAGTTPKWIDEVVKKGQAVVLCETRGVGGGRWTANGPPNYVRRSHALLGRTVESGRVWDVIAAAKHLKERGMSGGNSPDVFVAGHGPAGIIAAYAAVLEDAIGGAMLVAPPVSHSDANAPQFLNILRVGDAPDVLGLLAPRPLAIVQANPDDFARTKVAYAAAGRSEAFSAK